MRNRLLNIARVGTVVAATVLTTTGWAVASPQGDGQKTSDDQKNNRQDVSLTAKIRKAIVDDKTLSIAAHNVKIISENGNVTLRGQVNSEDERAAVVAKAQEIAGSANVSDQLTVAPDKK
jgi:osmotically-inducible protein OsmY